jgi:hypothetical protein
MILRRKFFIVEWTDRVGLCAVWQTLQQARWHEPDPCRIDERRNCCQSTKVGLLVGNRSSESADVTIEVLQP